MVERNSLPAPKRTPAKGGATAPKGTLTERKIYVLPTEQVERIKQFQTESGIASEVEAVRRLLDVALEMRDSVDSLLTKLKSRFAHEKDLRVLGRDILAAHSRVRSMAHTDDGLEFSLGADERGKIDKKGRIFIVGNGFGDWDEVKPHRETANNRSGTTSWAAPKPGPDLDDDIPF